MKRAIRRPKWSQSTREDVLLRCFFQCTWPGCTRLAADLHHVTMRSRGGSDSADNLIGLCKRCHEAVHREVEQLVHVDGYGAMIPIDAARHWLAQQLENCPVRLDQVCRSKLFAEVESAVRSVDHMQYHDQAIAPSGHWSNYEVFLKACWRYLQETHRSETTVGAVVLLKMVQLYRRRPSIAFQRAAARHLRVLVTLINQNPHRNQWLLGIATYEAGYMNYLTSAPSLAAEHTFQASVEFELKHGRPVGQLVSHAQAQVAALRRLVPAGANIESQVVELQKIRDQLSGISGPLANSWAYDSIPIHLAYISLMQGQYEQVIESMKSFVERKSSNALWYTGIAVLRSGEYSRAIELLESARRSFYREHRSEGRAGVLITLGDAFHLSGQVEEAQAAYQEAIKQPAHMDNTVAVALAKTRINHPIRQPAENYLM